MHGLTGAEVKNHPKDGDISALLVFMRIRYHDHSLSCPEQGSASTEKSAGHNDKRSISRMVI